MAVSGLVGRMVCREAAGTNGLRVWVLMGVEADEVLLSVLLVVVVVAAVVDVISLLLMLLLLTLLLIWLLTLWLLLKIA